MICSKCKTDKDLSDFSPNMRAKSGYQSACKCCRNLACKASPATKLYTIKYKVKQREIDLARKYGITENKYDEMFLEQEGKCLICETHQSKLSRALAVDHNHKTGKIRGLLCLTCNQAIGLLKDSAILCNKAAKYVEAR